jgi:hypothetical protein
MTTQSMSSARHEGHYLHNTQQIEETNIHVISGIRTPDTSNQAYSDPCLRSHGQWNRPKVRVLQICYCIPTILGLSWISIVIQKSESTDGLQMFTLQLY